MNASRRHIIRSGIATAAAVAVVGALAACGPAAESGGGGGELEPTQLVLAHSEATEGLPAEANIKFAELVTEYTGGKVTFEIFPAGQLGSLYEMQESLELGGIDIVMNSVGSLERYTDLAAIDGLPFLYDDAAHLIEVWNGELGAEILDAIADDSGFRLLGAMYRGPRILNTVRPVQSVSDMQGLKLRVPTQQTYIDTWTALGASPAPMAFSEVFGAMESGAIDGQENPIDVVRNNSLHEIAPYVTDTNHIYGNFHMQLWDERFQAMPAELQDALTRAAKEVSEWYTAQTEGQTEEDRKFLADAGVQFYQVDLEQLREMTAGQLAAADPTVREWAAKISALRG